MSPYNAEAPQLLLLTAASLLLLSGSSLALSLILAGRLARMRDALDEVARLQRASQSVQVVESIERLSRDIRREFAALEKRVRDLEEWRSEGRTDLIKTNERATRALDAIREELQTTRHEIAAAVALDVRTQIEDTIRRIAREEAHKAIAGAA